MTPGQRFEQFTRNMKFPTDLPGRPDFHPGEVFRDNWEVIEHRDQHMEAEVLRFREMLQRAVEIGSKREPKKHQIIVHPDWMKDQVQYGNRSVVRCLELMTQRFKDVRDAITLLAPGAGVEPNDGKISFVNNY